MYLNFWFCFVRIFVWVSVCFFGFKSPVFSTEIRLKIECFSHASHKTNQQATTVYENEQSWYFFAHWIFEPIQKIYKYIENIYHERETQTQKTGATFKHKYTRETIFESKYRDTKYKNRTKFIANEMNISEAVGISYTTKKSGELNVSRHSSSIYHDQSKSCVEWNAFLAHFDNHSLSSSFGIEAHWLFLLANLKSRLMKMSEIQLKTSFRKKLSEMLDAFKLLSYETKRSKTLDHLWMAKVDRWKSLQDIAKCGFFITNVHMRNKSSRYLNEMHAFKW